MTPAQAKWLIERELGWKEDESDSELPQSRQSPANFGSEKGIWEQNNGTSADHREASSTIAISEERNRRIWLERGWRKDKLIHEIALQEKTMTALAAQYGVVPSAITNFRHRHQAEILAVQQNLGDRFAALWVADKGRRIAEYQQDIEDINALQGSTPTAELTRIKHGALKNVAEELGHLPSKTQIQVNNAQVAYAFEGVDLDKL